MIKSRRGANLIQEAVSEVQQDLKIFTEDIERDFGSKERQRDTPAEIIRRLVAREVAEQ